MLQLPLIPTSPPSILVLCGVPFQAEPASGAGAADGISRQSSLTSTASAKAGTAVTPPVPPKSVVGSAGSVSSVGSALVSSSFVAPVVSTSAALSPTSGLAPAMTPVAAARVKALSTTDLKDVFKRALEFVRPFLQSSAADTPKSAGAPAPALVLGDAEKLKFYGYFKQATKGDQPPGMVAPADPVEAAKVQAWATVRGLSRRDAMRAFVFLLYQALPTWDDK